MLKRIDFSLLLVVVLLTLFGLLMIYDASSYSAFRNFGDKLHYVKEQFVWMFMGFGGILVFSRVDYRKFQKIAFPLLVISLFLLALVFLPGVGVYTLGARRWIHIGSFIIQPTEFIKPVLAIYLAAWFSKKQKEKILSFFGLVGFIMLLVMLEPDMGTALIILSEALIVYFLEGASLFYLAASVPVIAIFGIILIVIAPYRAARLTTFFNPAVSTLTSSYHVKQILISLGSGGIGGLGFGNSLQKYAYLPENTTDSIFAIIAEETGFIGGTILIGILFYIIFRGFTISLGAKDVFGRYLAAGITAFLGVQMVINLGAQTAAFPLTGVPLPFLSYGGSSLIVDLAAIGILLSISRRNA